MSRAYARARRHQSARHPATAMQSQNTNVVGAPLELADGHRAQALDIALDCGAKPQSRFENSVNQVRLSGALCQAEEEILSSEIRNDTNNTSATVFYPTASSYMTDYIALATGENRIRILNILKSGAREERELLIERAPADATTPAEN